LTYENSGRGGGGVSNDVIRRRRGGTKALMAHHEKKVCDFPAFIFSGIGRTTISLYTVKIKGGVPCQISFLVLKRKKKKKSEKLTFHFELDSALPVFPWLT